MNEQTDKWIDICECRVTSATEDDTNFINLSYTRYKVNVLGKVFYFYLHMRLDMTLIIGSVYVTSSMHDDMICCGLLSFTSHKCLVYCLSMENSHWKIRKYLEDCWSVMVCQ